ncbi:MAG: hypothetical protein ACRDE2_09085 [Chitinophagaceae bacterium]
MGAVKKYKTGKSRKKTVKEVSSLYDSVPESNIIIYETTDHKTRVEVKFDEETVMRKIGISDFSTKPTNFYNLDVIISMSHCVKSNDGPQFCQWVTQLG